MFILIQAGKLGLLGAGASQREHGDGSQDEQRREGTAMGGGHRYGPWGGGTFFESVLIAALLVRDRRV